MEAVIERIVQKSSIRVIPYDERYRAGTLEIAQQIHATSIYAAMPLNEEKLLRQLATVPDRWFRIAVRGEEVLGGFYGCKVLTFFNDECITKDIGWWVKPTARGGSAAVMLLAAFEEWSRSVGAKIAMVGQTGVENIDGTLRLFQHAGYRLTGYNTAKDLT